MFEKGTKLNPFITGFTNIIFSVLPNLFNDCPIKGHIELMNFTTTGEMFRFITKGLYKVNVHMYNDFDEIIVWVSYVFAKTSAGSG
jgi:hypothetical protein